jgi:hypothetical protein
MFTFQFFLLPHDRAHPSKSQITEPPTIGNNGQDPRQLSPDRTKNLTDIRPCLTMPVAHRPPIGTGDRNYHGP